VPAPPSGEQFEIVHDEQRATIVEVGGGIREYRSGERDVLEPYPLEQMCDGAHGAVLVPWPNRVADGRYRFDGRDLQLPLSEPATHNAIHGLARWRAWRPLERAADRVRMGIRLHPEPGYPFDLEVTVEYALAAEGLTVTSTATNVGWGPCPYASGQHPYLSPGGGTIDACALQLPAETLIETDPERQLPTGRRLPIAEGPLDYRSARPLGAAAIDSPFTDLLRGADGRARARLTAADGSSVELWVDRAYRVLEVFTGDTLAAGRRRRGLGLEPMTSPPNAFLSGEGLVRLEPGEVHRASWGAALTG
jgi:aldose 1-epimerase